MRIPVVSAAIFLAAFLLFALEPMVAKRMLPWFGGSAAVWSTCLVFYQCALLLGYGYAKVLTAWLGGRRAGYVHIGAVAVSLLFLPIGPGVAWSQPDLSYPASQILLMLTATIGLPFAVLSSTTPLLQAWAAAGGARLPYRLFAVSNLASLCALLLYPFAIEPALSVDAQMNIWSCLYVVFASLAGTAAVLTIRQRDGKAETREETSGRRVVLGTDRLTWFALSACGSVLLLAITNYMAANVAAVPLLWVLPLAVYLLTFIAAFRSGKTFRRALWLRLLAMALGILAYAIYDVNAIEAMQVSIPIFLGGLYVCVYYCHAELYARRPGAEDLTSFYLCVAAGGAAGAVAVGLAAPALFGGVYELPLALGGTAALATVLLWREGGWPLRGLSLGVTACMAATVVSNVHAYHENALALRRSFYGSLRVVQSPHAGPEQTRTLFHGTIEHGAQYVLLPRRLRPGTYYGPHSGIGIALREYPKSPKRVAVVGLGTGTVAAFGKTGDTFQFFEINGQVTEIAQSLFTYLRESKARTDVVEGDGRLALERDRSGLFDVIVLDAFSGDAIPVHLLTREAMQVYRKHLAADGALIVHVSNDFLNLPPVVEQLARISGFGSLLVRSHADVEEGLLPSDWIVVTRNKELLDNPGLRAHATAIAGTASAPLWTDGRNNLLEILKTPEWK